MKSILKKINSKLFLLFLCVFFSITAQAQWGEGGGNADSDGDGWPDWVEDAWDNTQDGQNTTYVYNDDGSLAGSYTPTADELQAAYDNYANNTNDSNTSSGSETGTVYDSNGTITSSNSMINRNMIAGTYIGGVNENGVIRVIVGVITLDPPANPTYAVVTYLLVYNYYIPQTGQVIERASDTGEPIDDVVDRLNAANNAPTTTPPTLPNKSPCDKKISKDELLELAKKTNLSVAQLLTVYNVETDGNAFRENGDPKVLFERHYFSNLTGGIYDNSHPNISNPVQGGYGLYSEQLEKLQEAYDLDPIAAIQSASYGGFQIMGANYKDAGYSDLQTFYKDMTSTNVDLHLNAFVNYITSKGLIDEIQNNQWTEFASKYNGPKYKDNDYDGKMQKEFEKLKNNINLLDNDCL